MAKRQSKTKQDETVEAKAITYDHKAAERSFTRTEDLRLQFSGAALPSLELPQSAAIALSVVEQLKEPQRVERMDLIHENLLPREIRERLEPAAWAVWYSSVLRTSAEESETNARVSLDLLTKATETKARMMRVVEYILGDHPVAGVEVSGIRAGSGHFDLAMDLSRLAVLYRDYADELVDAGSRYQAKDREAAHEHSGALLRELGSTDSADAVKARDDAARAFRLLETTYERLRRWAVAAFDDADRWFPSLYALRTVRGTSPSGGPGSGGPSFQGQGNGTSSNGTGAAVSVTDPVTR